MTITSIMQPTYLPWIGYFQQIHRADNFVFLDDVQFDKRSWQQRNRILLHGDEHYLTIPVQSKGKRDQLIIDVETDENQQWRKKHISTLRQAYQKHSFGPEIIEVVERVLGTTSEKLVDVTIEMITAICSMMELEPRFLRSSGLPVEGKKSAYLYEICTHLESDRYLGACGSRDYIENENIFGSRGLAVAYQDYRPRDYPQRGAAGFVPYLSIIDLIANMGCEEAVDHLTRQSASATRQKRDTA